jgi:hypothetical protein
MASYVIQIPQDSITDARKAAVEEAVRLAHAEITGTPRHVTKVESSRSTPAASISTAGSWNATTSSCTA